jgi:hypothetical protein
MRLPVALVAIRLVVSGAAFAQLPLEAMPVRVGGYVVNDQAQPVAAAVVRFVDQATLTDYEGVTDAGGWYGNVAFADVPTSRAPEALGQNYPNPFAGATTVEIAGDAVKSAAAPRDLLIYDLRGRLVGTVPAVAGTHDVATRGAGALPEGAYFYRLGDQTRRMVGTPRRVTIRIGADKAAGAKAITAWRRVITAAGFEPSDVLVELDDTRINFASIGLTPMVAQPRPLAIKVFNISGTEQLLDGAMTLARGTWSETQAAGVDSIYRFTIPADVDTVAFAISGFAGHDHAEQIFSVLRPDSVAARGWLADDERGAAVAGLPEMVFLEAVPEVRLDDPFFMESVGLDTRPNVIRHRSEDVRFVTYTNTYESGYTLPALAVTLNKLRVERDHYLGILDGGSVDGIALIGYSSTESSGAPYPWVIAEMQGRHDIFVANSVGPGNSQADVGSDGDIDYASSHISGATGQAGAREEIANPTQIYDNLSSGVVSFITDNLFYRDMIHTVMKSRLGR